MSNYSNDNDLKVYEPGILEHLPVTTPPTTSFDAQHAEAKRILDEIIIRRLPQGIKERVKRGEATMNDVVDESDLKTVSVFYTLFVIFNRLSTNKDDIFAVKASEYLELFKEKSADLSFDISTDNDADFDEEIDAGNIRIERG